MATRGVRPPISGPPVAVGGNRNISVLTTVGARIGVAVSTGTVANNNAPGIILWGPAGYTLTEAKAVEWATQRGIAGMTWMGGTQSRTVRSGSSDWYQFDGTTPMTNTADHQWYWLPAQTSWGATPNTRTWHQRSVELGFKQVNAMYSGSASGYGGAPAGQSFSANWHDHTAWGASTLAGALTPGDRGSPAIPSFLGDWTALCKACAANGITGLTFDHEQTNNFAHPYSGMPGGQNEAETRRLVMLRGMQMELIARTYIPGVEFFVYYDRSGGSWDELTQYTAGNTTDPNSMNGATYDSFHDGLAAGQAKVTQLAAEFYRETQRGSEGGDDHVADWGNAYSYNWNGRYARQTLHLLSIPSLTAAQRLASMRNLQRAGFIWLTAGGPPAVEGPVPTAAEGAVHIREAVRWSNGGRFGLYTQSLDDTITGTFTKNHNPFEAAFQTYCVPGVAQASSPTIAVTKINGSAAPAATTFSTSAATVTVELSASDEFSIWRCEWTNPAIGTTDICLSTLVVPANWVPLNGALLPNNSSLGRAAFTITLTATIPLAAAPSTNALSFVAYNHHGISTTVNLTVTRT